jgi:hypothetical protein
MNIQNLWWLFENHLHMNPSRLHLASVHATSVRQLLYSHLEATIRLKALLGDELQDSLPALLQNATDKKQNLIELVLQRRVQALVGLPQATKTEAFALQPNVTSALQGVLSQWASVQAVKERASTLMRAYQLPGISPSSQRLLIEKLKASCQQARLGGLTQLELDIKAFVVLAEESAKLGVRVDESRPARWRVRYQLEMVDSRLLHISYWQAMLSIASPAQRHQLARQAYQSLNLQVAQYWSDATHESWPKNLPDLEKLITFLAAWRTQLGIPRAPDQLLFIFTKMLAKALEMIRALPQPRDPQRAAALQQVNLMLQDMQQRILGLASQHELAEDPSSLLQVLASLMVHLTSLQHRIPKK